MIELTNLNLNRSTPIDKFSSVLNSNIRYNFLKEGLWISNSEYGYKKIDLEDLLQKQISSIYTPGIFNIIEKGCYGNDRILLDNSLRYCHPMWLKFNSFPDYHIIFSVNQNENFENRFTNATIENVTELKKYKKLFNEWNNSFEGAENRFSIFRSLSNNMFEVKAFNPTLNIHSTFEFFTPNTNFDSVLQNHSEVFSLFKNNNVIQPNLVDFNFHFNPTSLQGRKYIGVYFTESNLVKIDFDLNDINEKFGLNLTDKWNNIPNKYFDVPISGLKIKQNFNTDSNKISLLKSKNDKFIYAQILNNNLLPHVDKINWKNWLGTTEQSKSLPIRHVTFGDIKPNIKLHFSKEGVIFKKNDTITLESGNKRWMLFAGESDKCDCREYTDCKIESFDITFKSTDILNEYDSIEVVIPHYLNLMENEYVECQIGDKKFNKTIYRLRKNINLNETRFNLYMEKIEPWMLNEKYWNFKYTSPETYFVNFRYNEHPEIVIENINKAINSFSDCPFASFLDDYNLIIYSNNLDNKINLNLSKKTKIDNIFINDIKFKPLILGTLQSDRFNYNTSQFSGRCVNGVHITCPKESIDYININKDSLINTHFHNFELDCYDIFNEYKCHTNFWINDNIFRDVFSISVSNSTIEHFNKNVINITDKFYPTLIEIDVF